MNAGLFIAGISKQKNNNLSNKIISFTVVLFFIERILRSSKTLWIKEMVKEA